MNQQRKNKTNQTVTWPTTPYFTIDQIQKENPDMINITMRKKVTEAKENGKIAEIGYMHRDKGRPPKVYTMTPVSKIAVDKAVQDGITVENYDKLFNVVSVTPHSTSNFVPKTAMNHSASPIVG